MNENQNWHDRLRQIALADKRAATAKDLRQKRDELYRTSGLQALDAAITHLDGRPKQLREELRRDALAYILETGETELHDLIQFRRTTRPIYNDQAALDWCELEGETRYVKVKKSLDKRAFNRAIHDGDVDFPGAELVNDPQVAILAVEHLLEEF